MTAVRHVAEGTRVTRPSRQARTSWLAAAAKVAVAVSGAVLWARRDEMEGRDVVRLDNRQLHLTCLYESWHDSRRRGLHLQEDGRRLLAHAANGMTNGRRGSGGCRTVLLNRRHRVRAIEAGKAEGTVANPADALATGPPSTAGGAARHGAIGGGGGGSGGRVGGRQGTVGPAEATHTRAHACNASAASRARVGA